MSTATLTPDQSYLFACFSHSSLACLVIGIDPTSFLYESVPFLPSFPARESVYNRVRLIGGTKEIAFCIGQSLR